MPVRRARPAGGRRAGVEVHALLRPPEGRQGTGVRAGMPDQVEPVRRARGAARARRRARRDTHRGGRRARAALSARRGRWHRRRGRVLPAARRARGLRAAARPRRHDPRCGRVVEGGRCGRARARGCARGRGLGGAAMSAAPPLAREEPFYYGRPIIKEPVWTPEIPWYFFAGGLAGASAGLGYLCEVRGSPLLAKRAWGIALLGIVASPALLISDLGKPARFLNMLRMFKVTSPMSVGSWLLAGSGAATGVAALNAYTGRFRALAALGRP